MFGNGAEVFPTLLRRPRTRPRPLVVTACFGEGGGGADEAAWATHADRLPRRPMPGSSAHVSEAPLSAMVGVLGGVDWLWVCGCWWLWWLVLGCEVVAGPGAEWAEGDDEGWCEE